MERKDGCKHHQYSNRKKRRYKNLAATTASTTEKVGVKLDTLRNIGRPFGASSPFGTTPCDEYGAHGQARTYSAKMTLQFRWPKTGPLPQINAKRTVLMATVRKKFIFSPEKQERWCNLMVKTKRSQRLPWLMRNEGPLKCWKATALTWSKKLDVYR